MTDQERAELLGYQIQAAAMREALVVLLRLGPPRDLLLQMKAQYEAQRDELPIPAPTTGTLGQRHAIDILASLMSIYEDATRDVGKAALN
jgi:hypothetical protein